MLRLDPSGLFDLHQRRVDFVPGAKARFAQCDCSCRIDNGMVFRIECFDHLFVAWIRVRILIGGNQ
jgi:hypothetical protein